MSFVSVPDIEVVEIAGLPSVHLADPMSPRSIAALEALTERFGMDAIVDGDHESVAFDPERVTVEAIRSVLSSLE